SRSGTPRRSAVRACSVTASSTKPEPSNARSPTPAPATATATATESEAVPSTAASSPADASVIGTTAPSKPELVGAVLGSAVRPSPEAETSSSAPAPAPAAGRRANAPEVLPPATSTTGTVRSPSEVPSARVLARARAASTSARSPGH
ncbi:unnamed protein product, partial [Musa acuminata subsp. burmannicoides]